MVLIGVPALHLVELAIDKAFPLSAIHSDLSFRRLEIWECAYYRVLNAVDWLVIYLSSRWFVC